MRRYARNHYGRRIPQRKQSGTHGYRHVRTVENISVYIAGNILSERELTLLRIASLLHDCIRMPGDFDQRDHAAESAEYAGTLLRKMGLDKDDVEAVKTAIAEHSGRKWSSRISEMLWIADKAEQISPFAPFRRAMFVGEHIRSSSKPLEEEQAFDILLGLYEKRMRKLENFPERIREILGNIPDMNRYFYGEIVDNGQESWVWEMSWFAINQGYKNIEDILAFREYVRSINKMKENKRHEKYASLVRAYLLRWADAEPDIL